MRAVSAILLFVSLLISIPFAGIAFAISLRSSRLLFTLNLIYSAIALCVAFYFEKFFEPHYWSLAMGIFSVVTGFILFSMGNKFVENDVNNSEYFLSLRPVQEKLTKIGPGCFLTSQAIAYMLLGFAILLAQIVVTYISP